MGIHQFSDGLCADPQVNTSYYYEWINLIIIIYLYWILSISDTINVLYGVKWYVLLLLGCYFSDTKDPVASSDQTVWPSSADQNRLMSSINVSKWY